MAEGPGCVCAKTLIYRVVGLKDVLEGCCQAPWSSMTRLRIGEVVLIRQCAYSMGSSLAYNAVVILNYNTVSVKYFRLFKNTRKWYNIN